MFSFFFFGGGGAFRGWMFSFVFVGGGLGDVGGLGGAGQGGCKVVQLVRRLGGSPRTGSFSFSAKRSQKPAQGKARPCKRQERREPSISRCDIRTVGPDCVQVSINKHLTLGRKPN